jgi:cytochrome c5
MIRHKLLAPVLVYAFFVVAACSGPASAPEPPQPAKTASADTKSAKVDIDAIFPAGLGRELLLNNCTSCHTFVPIVMLQMTREAWERNSRDHRGRVTALSDADFKTLYNYLIANFNPDRPVPKLPKELLDTWTSY